MAASLLTPIGVAACRLVALFLTARTHIPIDYLSLIRQINVGVGWYLQDICVHLGFMVGLIIKRSAFVLVKTTMFIVVLLI